MYKTGSSGAQKVRGLRVQKESLGNHKKKEIGGEREGEKEKEINKESSLG